jgi:hypothetical protein
MLRDSLRKTFERELYGIDLQQNIQANEFTAG